MVTSSEERVFFSRLIRLAFFAVSLATVIALFSRFHWFAELFSHFRFYFLLIQALLLLIFLHRKHWLLLTATVLLTVPNAWYVTPYLTPFVLNASVAARETDTLEIVALNVNYKNRDYESMRSYLESVSPDVIVLAEMTSAWREQLKFLDSRYPHQVGELREDPFGMIVYSRVPFVAAEMIDLGAADSVNARVVVDMGAGPVEVFAVHLFPPTSPIHAADRNIQITELARRVAASELPTAVVGDLNVTPFSPYFKRLLDTAGMVDARRASGIHFTWPASPVPLWIPIDHALADTAVDIISVRRGPDAGSDHYPLEVSIACCESEAG